MPQVDLETLVSACAGGGSDRKIACETLTDNKDDTPESDDVQHMESSTGADFPPESFWLSKDAEFDWFDRNAFYERKESTKGITHSTSTHMHPNSTSNSQRFSLNLTSKASIIGLPKTQKASYVDGKRRNGTKPANVRLLPKRPTTVGKQASTLTEPSSPKVSCMGRVRSKRRSRRSSDSGRKRDKPVERSSESGKKITKPIERSRSSSSREKQKTGFGSKFMAMFRPGKSHKKPVQKDVGQVKEESTVEEAPRRSMSASKRVREIPESVEPVADPPGLGGMKRFASGRKSTEDFDGVITGSLNLDRRVGPTGSN